MFGTLMVFLWNMFFPVFMLSKCLVSDRWKLVNTVWSGNWNWRCEPRGRVTDELVGLQHVLNSLSLATCDIDKWQWSLATNENFTVHKLVSFVDRNILGPLSIGWNHNWNNWTPIKVNICIWRATNNRLPTLFALNSKGIILASLLCPLCNEATETIDHVLYECLLACRIWLKMLALVGHCRSYPLRYKRCYFPISCPNRFQID